MKHLTRNNKFVILLVFIKAERKDYMWGIKAEELNNEELTKYCKQIFKCFETEPIISMSGNELEETEIYAEAMCLQSIFTERGLQLPL